MSLIRRFTRRDGGLASLYPLVSWIPGETVVILDGEFSAAQLREMADHMDRHREPTPWPYLARGG
jgi:hypothetical protein